MTRRFRVRVRRWSPIGAPALLGLLILVGGCAARTLPVLPELRDRQPKTPLLILPGTMGSKLRERAGGQVLWGDLRSMFLPRDGGASLALPLGPNVSSARLLEAHAPVMGFRALFGLLEADVYRSLLRLLERNGYRLGDLDDPRPGDSLFFFPYDWRRGKIEAARQLIDALHSLRRARGGESLAVHLICHSDAALVARYVLKYGAASLEEAEAGAGRLPPDIQIAKLILVGSANGGALGTLEDLDRGAGFVPLLGRSFRPEVVFTFPSVFESLPVYRSELFFDETGSSVPADLFDPATWERFQWSIFAPEVVTRLRRRPRPDLFGDLQSRRDHLAASLDRARRLHGVLHRDARGFGRPSYYVLGNAYRPTGERALVTRIGGRWRTFFADDQRVRSRPFLHSLAAAPGDGHATLNSLLWLSPQERAAIVGTPIHIPRYHRRIILGEASHRWILEFLLESSG